MTRSQKVFVWTLALAPAIYIAAFHYSRVTTAQDESCEVLDAVKSGGVPVVEFRWHPAGHGDGGRWKVHFNTDGEVAPTHLLIESVDPPFNGFTTPFLISSDSGRQPTSAVVQSPEFLLRHRTSYAKFDAEALEPLMATRYEGVFPVPAGRVMQVDGRSRLLWGKSHTVERGNVNAIDIAAPMGSAVLAIRPGLVVFVESGHPDSKCTSASAMVERDNKIVVLHDDGTEAVYSHLMQGSTHVSAGDSVEAGQTIARVGMSGSAAAPHLHLEVGALFGTQGYRTLPLAFHCPQASTPANSTEAFVPRLGGTYCP